MGHLLLKCNVLVSDSCPLRIMAPYACYVFGIKGHAELESKNKQIRD